MATRLIPRELADSDLWTPSERSIEAALILMEGRHVGHDELLCRGRRPELIQHIVYRAPVVVVHVSGPEFTGPEEHHQRDQQTSGSAGHGWRTTDR